MLQPAGEHIHAALFRVHAYLVTGEFSCFSGGIAQHSGGNTGVAEINAPAFGRLQTDVIDPTEMTIGVEVDLVGGPRGADIDPGLMLEQQVGHEILGFRDAFTYLQYAQVDVLELIKALEVTRALPAFHIGLGHSGRVLLSQLMGLLQ